MAKAREAVTGPLIATRPAFMTSPMTKTPKPAVLVSYRLISVAAELLAAGGVELDRRSELRQAG